MILRSLMLQVCIKTCTSCGCDGWLSPEICTKGKGYIEQTNSALNASQCSRALSLKQFETGLTLL